MLGKTEWRVVRVCAILASGVIGGALAPAARAQVSFGSPADPPRVALGAGAFNLTPNANHPGGTAAELGIEYRFGDVLWFVSPFIGVSGTSDGAFTAMAGSGSISISALTWC